MYKQSFKSFTNKVELYNFLEKHIDGFDAKASFNMPLFTFKYKGQTYRPLNLLTFLTKINEISTLDFDIATSVQRGFSFVLFFKNQAPVDPDVAKAQAAAEKKAEAEAKKAAAEKAAEEKEAQAKVNAEKVEEAAKAEENAEAKKSAEKANKKNNNKK